MKAINLTEFVQSYLTTVAWCENEESKRISKKTYKQAEHDCNVFIDKCIQHFGNDKAIELLTTPGYDLTYLAPHDFWLTRNGHGAGFWDKPEMYGDQECNELTLIAKEMGVCDTYQTSKFINFY